MQRSRVRLLTINDDDNETTQSSSVGGMGSENYIPKFTGKNTPKTPLSNRSVRSSISSADTPQVKSPMDRLNGLLADSGVLAEMFIAEAEYSSLQKTDRMLSTLLEEVKWHKSNKKLRKSYKELITPLLENNPNLTVKISHPKFGIVSLIPLSKDIKKTDDLRVLLVGAKPCRRRCLHNRRLA